jgi:hypothetical protein
MLSVIVPYLSNSRCIGTCKRLLEENTVNDYKLVEIVDWTDVYAAFNHGVHVSDEDDTVVLLSDDMFVAKGWDVPYVKHIGNKVVCTGYLIEPGALEVSKRNVEKNFGKTPETFQESVFMQWADEFKKTIPEVVTGKGWYMPLVMRKRDWINYPNERKFPHSPNDIELVDNILPSMGYEFRKVNSVCYHLQAFSARKDVKRD